MVTITKLTPDDWQQYKALRLEALQTDPFAFGGSYEEEVEFTEAVWRERIGAMWFALVDGEPIGTVGLLVPELQALRHKALLVAVWVKPVFRGRGIAKRLLEEMQNIARAKGLVKICLDVTTTQAVAIKLYESLGFRKIGLLEKELFKSGRYFDQYAMEWLI